jgi:hypothetical protein
MSRRLVWLSALANSGGGAGVGCIRVANAWSDNWEQRIGNTLVQLFCAHESDSIGTVEGAGEANLGCEQPTTHPRLASPEFGGNHSRR